MSIPEVEVRHTTETRYPERRRLSGRSVIEAAKEIPTLDLADRLCGPGQMRKVGKEWAALCPLPDHTERTPSFTVDPGKNVWFCFGCLRGGDVVELARFAWGYEKQEAAMAAANLLHEFGHPIPEKPASWYGKQRRQKPARDALQEAKIRHLQRRVFRIFLPMIEEIEDEDERRTEIEFLWDAAQEIAVCLWAGRRAA
jgi:CHC2-type zinc finger protein